MAVAIPSLVPSPPSSSPPSRSTLLSRLRGHSPPHLPSPSQSTMPPPNHTRQRSGSVPPSPQQPPLSPSAQFAPAPGPPQQPPSQARELSNPFNYLRTRRGGAAATTVSTAVPANPAPLNSATSPTSPGQSSSPHHHLNLLHRRHTAQQMPANANPSAGAALSPGVSANPPPTHRIRLVPHLESARTLIFDPIVRHLPEGGPAIRIGRFTERRANSGANREDESKIAFRSKVVSRGHAELWCDPGGKASHHLDPSFFSILTHRRLC